MPDFQDSVGEMMSDLLAEAGETYTYRVGSNGVAAQVTAARSDPPSFQIDNGNGLLVEVRPVEFKMLTSDLPFGDPVKGHRFERAGSVWEVQPTVSEKVFYQQSPQMTRIHVKLIKEPV